MYVSLFLVAFTANKLTEITRHRTDSPFLNEFPESMEGVTLLNLDSHHEYPHVPLTVGEKYSLTLFKCVYFWSYPFPRPDRSPVWALFKLSKLFKHAGVTLLWLLTGTGRSCEFGLTSVRFKSVFGYEAANWIPRMRTGRRRRDDSYRPLGCHTVDKMSLTSSCTILSHWRNFGTRITAVTM